MRFSGKLTIIIMTLGLGAAACGDGSTPELCNEACILWNACDDSGGWYPYDTCMSDCRAQGDWDSDYVSCLRVQATCQGMESTCG